MKVRIQRRRLLMLAVVAGFALPALQAADATSAVVETRDAGFGTIVGVIRTATKLPVAGATVTAVRTDGKGIRATVSSSDGVYSFADLTPGGWSVTSQADGYPNTEAASLEVTAGRATRSDILMAAPAVISSLKAPPAPAVLATSAATGKPPSGANQPAATPNPANDSIWRRWSRGEKVAFKDLDKVFASQPKTHEVQTAGLTTPASAFDRAAADIADPGPFPSPQPAAVAPAAPKFSPALELPDATAGVDNQTPFAFGDFTWLNGTPRNKDTVLDTKFFTPEVRFDSNYILDFNQPIDHTMGGSTEEFRDGEFQVEQASVGGDFHWDNVRGRILFMMGLFATTTPRNDASAGVGQWDLRDAYRYVSEAYGGYHFNVSHGLNVDAGIFASYIGLFSYYNFDNWTYQPSYVSSNTPWFFNGLRVQWFVTNKLKIEPWIINGWQSYARYNGHPGLGGQILWMPHEWIKVVSNSYGYGTDTLGMPKVQRIHSDNSIELRFYNNQATSGLSKIAMSFTADGGCQYGGGISCTGGPNKSSFLGWMEYTRFWFNHDKYAVTLGGGQMNNTGRYLTLLPPIDGADAVSGSPYFTENPGQAAKMWDSTVTFHYMPRQYITFWSEVGYRHSDVPYFSGRGGITPPGGNNDAPQYYTCASGASAGTADLSTAEAACGGGASSVWFPDLRRSTSSLGFGIMVKF